jgi:MoaA/NifB/PqqE/SkfB family radical SAM enzyme
MADEKRICGLLNLTVKCNQNCLFCCDGELKDSGYHLTFEEAQEKVAHIAAQGADSITFIGGEPLVQKYLVELVRFAREQGLRVGLTTNGTLLTEERLDALLDAGLTSLELSVHSFDPARADEISRGKGTAEKQRRALELLKARHARGDAPGLSINFVLFARNYTELPAFARTVAADYPFVDELFINFLDPIGYPAKDPTLLPGYLEVQPYLIEALDVAREAGISFTVDSTPGCILGPYFLYLRATREKLRGVLYAKQTLDIRNPEPDPDLSQYYRVNACHECPISGLCPGVNFRYLALRGAGEFRPFPADALALGRFHRPPEADEALVEELGQAALELMTAEEEEPDEIRLTWQCNNHCRWCACRDGAGQEPSPVRLVNRIARACDRRREAPVLLDGGEPALHTGFFKFMQLLARTRRVGFATNGRLFAYAQWVRKAMRSGASFAVVRLPAPFGAIGETAGEPAAEGQTRKGLENLLAERRLLVTAEVSVPAGTDGRLVPTLEELGDLGVFRVRVVAEEGLSDGRLAEVRSAAARLRLQLIL